VFYILAANLNAQYPSLCRETVTKALEYSMEKRSIFNTKTRKIIVELNKICLNNSATQFYNQLYTKKRIITGDNHSASLANNTVHCTCSGLLVY